jgi:hypothetical protein
MIYKGGTQAGQNCIAKLTELGALVDVYSSKWLAKNPDFYFFDEYDLADYQRKSKNFCSGHLLIISTDCNYQEVASNLNSTYPEFKSVLGEGTSSHKPDFIIINLATKQILCIGLHRKNYFFGFALGDVNVKVREDSLRNSSSDWGRPIGNDPTNLFISEFVKYDFANIVLELLTALLEFGSFTRNLDYLPLTQDLILEIIENGPDENGMYDIDGEMMTLIEARAVLAEFDQYEEMAIDHLHTLQQFFPDLTWSDLTTQDY